MCIKNNFELILKLYVKLDSQGLVLEIKLIFLWKYTSLFVSKKFNWF